MRHFSRSACTLIVSLVLTAPCLHAQAGDTALVTRARAIHQRVLALDTHNDISPANFTAERNYTQRLDNQVNLPKMIEGGLDASFFIVFVGQQDDFTPAGYQRAYEQAIEKFDAIHRLAKQIAPDKIGLALTAEDVWRIAASGRKVALIGVENAYPLGEDLGKIKEFYDRGGRYLSLAHNGHSQFSDSNTGETTGWKWNGLSPLGQKAIAEMNRVGIMIDVSHPSKESMMQAVKMSKAPIIASHSAVRALCGHSRNMDDEQLRALAKNGGVIQTVAFASYVKCDPPSAARTQALDRLRAEFGLPANTPLGGRAGRGGGGGGGGGPGGGRGAGRGGRGGAAAALDSLPADRRAELDRRVAQIDSQYPLPRRATVQDFVNHIDYAVRLIGIDHVGISSDFDGGGGVDGWSDASETFNVTLELVRRGFTEDEIAKLWSGNLLRVMAEVQRVAKTLQKL